MVFYGNLGVLFVINEGLELYFFFYNFERIFLFFIIGV